MQIDTNPIGPEIVVIILVGGGIVAFIVVYASGRMVRWIDSKFSPVKYVKGLLYAEMPLEISSPLSATMVFERLRGEITRFAFPLTMSERLVGVLTRGTLKIRAHRPFISNSFAPLFVGNIEQGEHQTYVRGVFRHSLFVRGFMTLWFGFLAALSIIIIPGGLIMLLMGDIDGVVYVFAPIVMFGFGILLLKLGNVFGSKDRDVIRAKITDAIGGVVV